MGYCDNMAAEVKTASFWRDGVAEGVATFYLVSIQVALPLTWGATRFGGVVEIGVGMAFLLVGLVEIFSSFGGAHMNPAVTISMVVVKKTSIARGILYLVFQCIGGVGGAAFIYCVTPPNMREQLGATTVNESLEWWQGMLVEAWLTALLLLTICGAICHQRRSVLMPSIPIGLIIGMDVMVGLPYTGGSMNPARSLGPAVIMNIWDKHWVYWAGPISGGILATLFFTFILDGIGRQDLESPDEPLPDLDRAAYVNSCLAAMDHNSFTTNNETDTQL